MFLNFDENRVLEVLYWQDTPYKDARRELDWQTETYIKKIEANALGKMAYTLRCQPVTYYRLNR